MVCHSCSANTGQIIIRLSNHGVNVADLAEIGAHLKKCKDCKKFRERATDQLMRHVLFAMIAEILRATKRKLRMLKDAY